MQPKSVATIAELHKILVTESGDPFVKWGDLWVRKKVGRKLKRIQRQLKNLDSCYDLLVTEGYRSPIHQERYFLQEFLQEYQKNPLCGLDQLIENTHGYVALPSVAGHPTGGAVDVTLLWEGKEIDMGCKIGDFSDPAVLPTFADSVSLEQAVNRKILHDLMLMEGFAPFYGEWWHFSYGDREWAVFYNRPEALYATVTINKGLLNSCAGKFLALKL